MFLGVCNVFCLYNVTLIGERFYLENGGNDLHFNVCLESKSLCRYRHYDSGING